jgi:two-component system, chemotaxis family, sensor kinase CheA
LRVDAERVDALVRLTGELTVVKNAIGHTLNLAGGEQALFAESLRGHQATLDQLVGELQRAVLAVRVLPLRTVLQRIPRLVRETAASLSKQVNLIVEGDETEADKTIVEMLFEPLLHLVRNAIDHGIEEVPVRSQRNKPPVATLSIRASRQGGHVHIDVDDDGAGIDPDRVRQKARERELVETERLDAMTEAEVIELVFAPGFSTASEVTGLSGRGVGMDAVRSAVERVGGRVSLQSRKGQGTSVKLTLPFSVMMTQVLTAEVSGQMFGIPLESVVETVSVPVDTIEAIGAAKAIVRRDRTIPVFDLAQLLRVNATVLEQSEATIVVTSVGGHLNAIRVDRIGERMEVMLKPLDGLLASLPGISGTSIIGDGRVLLVLDLAEVIQ